MRVISVWVFGYVLIGGCRSKRGFFIQLKLPASIKG